MSHRYRCACSAVATLFAMLSVSSIHAQSSRPVLRLVDASTSEACLNESPRGSAGTDRPSHFREFSFGYFEDACMTLRRAEWRKGTAEPADTPDSVTPGDPIESELQSMGAVGLPIARARQKVLEILREGSTCSAWFAQAEPDPAVKFASLHFHADSSGESTVLGDYNSSGLYYRQPYVARARQNVGTGSIITVNVHGAFFQLRAPTELRIPNGGARIRQTPGYLQVGDYPGGTLQAQVTTLLHEFAHIVGLLPVDYGEPGSAQLSTQNTRTVLRHCRRQIEASPKRTVLPPAWLATLEPLAKNK